MAEKKPPLNPDTQSRLMGDLESIENLLESDDDQNQGVDDDDALNIPVLDDVVDTSTSRDRAGPAVTKDSWKMASDAFIAHAKALLQSRGLGDHLSEVQTALIDALVDTLKAAVDQEVEHIRTELHTRLQVELDHIKSELSNDGD
jgi:pyruvate-formate lyase